MTLFKMAWCRTLMIVMAWLMLTSLLPVNAARAEPVPAAQATAVPAEDGGTDSSSLFDFEAFIKADNISDGTAPFDADSQPGNDANDHNKIVRSWDTVTYPIKVTINPKQADKLENIKLKISGTLDNGIVNDRVNARFAVGGYSDMNQKKVGFTQNYTIERTGNSVMIPVAIEVLGAKPGVVLTPHLKVDVESVDGERIDGVSTSFDDLPGVTVSAKVNIKPMVGAGLTDSGYSYMPYSKMMNDKRGDEYDRTGVYAFAVSWSIDRLSGRSDMRGATFPDPRGKINYHLDFYGDVYWSSGPRQGRSDSFDFNGPDKPMKLYDYRPIGGPTNRVGNTNTLSDGLSYRFNQQYNFWAPHSSMINPRLGDWEKVHAVLDSGSWSVSRPNQSRSAVTYQGQNTGFKIGDWFPTHMANKTPPSWGNTFGVNDKIFSSQGFLVDMQNEYRIDGPKNPNNYSNNVYNRVRVTLDSYTDETGHTDNYNKTGYYTNMQRNETGSIAAYTTFTGQPGYSWGSGWGALSDRQIHGWGESVGDASTIIGTDVYMSAKTVTEFALYGGQQLLWRWNTDAFELTKDYAERGKQSIMNRGYRNLTYDWVANDTAHQKVYYGVAKFPRTDNEFQAFMHKGMNDYAWYESYDDAVSHGRVGAMKTDITAPIGGIKSEPAYIPLHVRTDNIGFGSETKDGTPIVGAVNYYAYPERDRSKKMIDIYRNQSYSNPSKWDGQGNLLEMQRPVGGTVPFDTLGIIPAKTSTVIKSDKDTYYNSETIHWTVENSIALPSYGVPEGIDPGIKVTQTLPKGLSYKPGTGRVGDQAIEPEVVKNSDGTTNLVWSLLVSNQTRKIPTVTFSTSVNPFALSDNGVSSSVTVKSVIESDLDGRSEASRSSTKSVTILKVGMVGIYESINKTYGDKNSNYVVTLSPYTTIEDESGVTGLTHLPVSSDELGSSYSGSAKISTINLSVNRVADDPVTLYLNHSYIESDKPQDIDVTKNGWYKYTGAASELTGAKSLLFKVGGKMTNKDSISINLTVATQNNAFGDTYLNETSINSDTDYKLSPVSNRVRYTIRADLELKLERFQIYTNKASSGLPTSVRVAQTVLNPGAVKDKSITLAIYDKDSGRKVTQKTYKQSDLLRENKFTIPSGVLSKDTSKTYEVRIQDFDTNTIWVRDGEGLLDTDGYTAKEGTLTISDTASGSDADYKGVVMTERELGKDMTKYYETIHVPKIAQPTVKSGYGFSFAPSVTYTNDLMSDVAAQIPSVVFTPEAVFNVNHSLVDQSLSFYDKNKNYGDNDTVPIGLDRTSTASPNAYKNDYTFPQMYLAQDNGLTYTAAQKTAGAITGPAVDAGRKLYVPIWIKHTGVYNAAFASKTPIGSNQMSWDVSRSINIPAYMFHHEDSPTAQDDELLVEPMPQSKIPDDLNAP